jgi:aryl-alcohol dehydrogenase-like predicted oxidoreductase
VEQLRSIARERGVSVAQLALRWIMDRYSFACPLFGARTADQVQDNLGAVGWCLSRTEVMAIDKVFSSAAGVAEHG